MHTVFNLFRTLGRRLLAWLAVPLVLAALVNQALSFVRRRVERRKRDVATSRAILPSLADRYPQATQAPRRHIGVRSVPIDRIVGTVRDPSQNTADFLPLPDLRGQNWRARWQRITRAMDRLVSLPPVEVVQVGDEYFVVDGHNRVAAAREAGAVDIDADVTQLVMPGMSYRSVPSVRSGSLIGADAIRQAASGRISRTVEQRTAEDHLSRRDLLREPEAEEKG